MTARGKKHAQTKKSTAKPAAELSFFAKDFPHHPKNNFWFVGIGVLALALLVVFYRAGEYLLMLVVLAALLALFRLAHLEPRQYQVRLNHRGVTWGDEFYPYFRLRSFWVAEAEGTTSVYVERLNLAPTLHFLIPENRLEEVVAYLGEYLPWHSHRNVPLGDRLNRLLRF